MSIHRYIHAFCTKKRTHELLEMIWLLDWINGNRIFSFLYPT